MIACRHFGFPFRWIVNFKRLNQTNDQNLWVSLIYDVAIIHFCLAAFLFWSDNCDVIKLWRHLLATLLSIWLWIFHVYFHTIKTSSNISLSRVLSKKLHSSQKSFFLSSVKFRPRGLNKTLEITEFVENLFSFDL